MHLSSLSDVLCWISYIVVLLSFPSPFPLFCTFSCVGFLCGLIGLTGQKEHWKAGHKLECKKPAAQGSREGGGGLEEEEGEGKPNL